MPQIAATPAPLGPGSASALLAGPGTRTLLLVEDSRHASEAMRLLAQRLGWRLRRAETLAAARRHLGLYRPDLAVVDLGLPDGPGLSLIAEMAAGPVPPSRVVAISAEAEGREAALAAGAAAFVAKPLRLPADLPALFGPGALADPGLPLPDPLALRDDLVRAERALQEGGLAYAARFVIGLARCAGDDGLGRAAERARQSGRTDELRAALAARMGQLEPGMAI